MATCNMDGVVAEFVSDEWVASRFQQTLGERKETLDAMGIIVLFTATTH